MSHTSKPTKPVPEVDLSHLSFDSTNKIDYLVKEARIRSTEVYLTAALLAEMEETWGGTFSALKTITDVPSQKVYVFPAAPKETDDVVPVRKSDTLAAASFSFFIPLKKLSLKLRKDRQITVVPQVVTVKGLGNAYCFSLAGVRATKRPNEGEAAPAEARTSAKGTASPKVTPEAKQEAEGTTAPVAKATKAKSKPAKESTVAAGTNSEDQ